MIFKQSLLLKVLLLIGLQLLGLSEEKNKYNISHEKLETCKEYDIRGTGYLYTDFFHVPSMNNNQIAKNERLHLKFYVMTDKDAHILLSVNNRPRRDDRVYEIVIGAGSNTFSTIRTSMARRRVATNQDTGLLSTFDPTPIEIVQTIVGDLLVYIPGFKEEPLLNYTDSSPLNINYISFSSFERTNARWFYDCEFDGFASEIEQEVRTLTPRQRLLANITAKAQNKTMPEMLQIINFAFQIHAISYKQKASILQTRMNLIMYWNDSRLEWNPEDFNDVSTIMASELDIWTPNIIVLNAALKTQLNFKPTYDIKLHANGSISVLATDVELTTWCFNRARNWPNDQLRCELALGLDEFATSADDDAQLLQLAYDTTSPFSKEPVGTVADWQFVQISVTRLENSSTVVGRFNDQGILQTMEGDISIEFTIARNNEFYKSIFRNPILACQTLILISFILRGYRRGAIILVVFVVLAFGMMFMTKHAPPTYIPDLMIVYQHYMRLTTACYLLHIVIMWLEMYPPKAKPWNWLFAVINSSYLRFVLCMRFADSTEYVDIQEHPWRELAKILNYLSFIVITATAFLINALLL